MRIALLGPMEPRSILLNAGQEIPLGSGGSPISSLAKALLHRGHEVHAITLSSFVDEPWQSKQGNLSVLVLPMRKSARARAFDFFRKERMEIRRATRSLDVDIIHAHWAYEYGWAAAKSGKPHLVTLHDVPWRVLRWNPTPFRLLRLLLAVLVRLNAKSFSAVSPYTAKAWFLGARAAVTPNMAPNWHLGIREVSKDPLIIDVADGSPWKNVRPLIRAFALVRAEFPGAKLRLMGGGLESTSPLAEWAKSQAIEHGIDFLGHLDHEKIRKEVAQATVFCHPSLEETQGMSMIEAMSLGVPIVGSQNSRGTRWTLGFGTAGVLVNTRDPKEIASALVSLLEDSQRYENLVTAGRHQVEELFSELEVVSRFEREYERIVSQ